jgi:purine-nucleoside phosphorylase
MSNHISAEYGEIAENVLICGDPLRAKFIAECYLAGAVLVNEIRNMFGYTGITHDGKRVSVMGTGMGMASTSIYINELIEFYKVKKIIRVGSAGSMQEKIACRSIVIAQGSCSDAALNISRFQPGVIYAPIADWKLLLDSYEVAKGMNIEVHVGNIFATDSFYGSDGWEKLAKYNVLAVEMETAEIYTLAAKHGVKALTLLTISDNLVTGEKVSAKDRESTFDDMIKIALAVAVI